MFIEEELHNALTATDLSPVTDLSLVRTDTSDAFRFRGSLKRDASTGDTGPLETHGLDEDGAVFVDVGTAMWHQLEPENPGHKSWSCVAVPSSEMQ